MQRLQAFAKFIYRAITHFDQVNCSQQAAALTFSTLLALVPVLAVIFTTITFFPWFNDISQHLQNLIFENFVSSAGAAIQNYLQEFLQRAGQLSKVSFMAMIFTGVLLIFSVESCLNQIWCVPHRRPLGLAFALYLLVLLVVPILVTISFLITTHLLNWQPIVMLVHWFGLTHSGINWLGLVFSGAIFVFLYQLLPNCRVKFKYALIGGIVAAILFELAKIGFGWYLVYVANYEKLYGAVAAVPIFLVWIYVCWLITLIGGVIVYILHIERK